MLWEVSIYFLFFFFNPPNIYEAFTLQAQCRGQSCDQVAIVPAGWRLSLVGDRSDMSWAGMGGHRELPRH